MSAPVRRLQPVAPYKTPEYHPAFEEYCEAIFELKEDAVDVIQARIAERLEVSRPAVSEMIKRMEHEGLVSIDGTISLTVDGSRLAESVVRRHRLAEVFLTDILGLSWAEAHSEAGRWEHVISDRVEEAMIKLLGDPTTCPHGNPIPGSVPDARNYLKDHGAIRLLLAPPGQSMRLLLVSEVVEDEEAIIYYLHDRGIVPGTQLELDSGPPQPDESDAVLALADGSQLTIPARVAYALWVVAM